MAASATTERHRCSTDSPMRSTSRARRCSCASERQRLIASNIANADTPGYIARDMDFAQALRAATGTLPAASALRAAGRPSRQHARPA